MQKNKPWANKQTKIFVAVLSSTESREKPFALALETMVLKKTANETVFNNVREEFEDILVAEGIPAGLEDHCFTIDQLQQKYKWLKKQWKAINASIRSGSGLGLKGTETPYWYDLIEPIFIESVDSFTVISSKAEDLKSVDSNNLDSNEKTLTLTKIRLLISSEPKLAIWDPQAQFLGNFKQKSYMELSSILPKGMDFALLILHLYMLLLELRQASQLSL